MYESISDEQYIAFLGIKWKLEVFIFATYVDFGLADSWQMEAKI